MRELPHWDGSLDDAPRCVAELDEWAESVAASGLLTVFGSGGTKRSSAGDAASTGAALFDFLDEFSGDHWDFRSGRERNLATAPQFREDQLAVIEAVIPQLGLAGTPAPRRRHYDAVVMTGGMVRAGIVKPRFLRELTDSGLNWDDGVFLGALRPFGGDEAEVAARLGVAGETEFDAMVAGMTRAFPPAVAPKLLDAPHHILNLSWRELGWTSDGRRVRVVAAPSSDRGRRANTADTYRFWAGRLPASVRSVLVITTPVYVPYQGAVAVSVLGLEFGLAVETVAVSESASDLGELTQEFLPHHQLQELRSAIRGMRELRMNLAALSGSAHPGSVTARPV